MNGESESIGPLSREKVARLRVLDAAGNRTVEGLRVIEDYARFVIDDRHLTAECKELRHEIVAALSHIDRGLLAAARETEHDVGASVETTAEYARADLASVVNAAVKRVQQGLRTLEEFAKVAGEAGEQPSAANAARRFEACRYRSYTLEKALAAVKAGCDRLADISLLVLADGCDEATEFDGRIQQLLAAGVRGFQLRDKRLDDPQLLDRARRLVSAVRASGGVAIVNDRPDLAALAGADGVHLGQEDLPPYEARRIVGPEALIGVSTHSIEQARDAVRAGANYIGVGPVFASRTKDFDQLAGLDYVRQAMAEVGPPAFAIGGIDAGNLDQVLAAGARRIAIGAAVWKAEDPAASAAKLLDALR